jgi:hypothetical protein
MASAQQLQNLKKSSTNTNNLVHFSDIIVPGRDSCSGIMWSSRWLFLGNIHPNRSFLLFNELVEYLSHLRNVHYNAPASSSCIEDGIKDLGIACILTSDLCCLSATVSMPK